MKAKMPCTIVTILLLAGLSNATEIPAGAVSGDWYSSGNPYNINGEIYVDSTTTLYIHEGVTIIFQGHYTLTVYGRLRAIGTESDSILFTAADTSLGWGDVLFRDSNTANILSYCILQYGKAYGTSDCGGAVELINATATINHSTLRYNNAYLSGGGICCWEASNLTLESCLFTENQSVYDGGGISLYEATYISMNNCTVSNNQADMLGGGMSFFYSSGDVSNCLFSGNQAIGGGGGGLLCISPGCNPTFSNCTFADNSAAANGGGAMCREGASATFLNCAFSGNYAGNNGGGIVMISPDIVILEYCQITNNTAAVNGGGIRIYTATDPTIKNCTIANNVSVGGVGGGISLYYSTPAIVNTIIEGNEGNGGVYFNDLTPLTLAYCDIANNFPQNYMGSVPTGLGILTGVNANGDSCDVFMNICADPLFEDPGTGNYQITWANYPIWDETQSPCIDAGDPSSPHDPDSTVADMGAFYFDQGSASPVMITLTPYGAPIQIPAGGGSFNFNIAIANTGTNPETFDIWTMATLPNGNPFGPILNVPDFTAPANWSANRDRTQAVPGNAPAGQYTYDAYVGVYPNQIWDEDHFGFEKAAGAGDARVFGWECYGEGLGDYASATATPEKYMLLKACPNPFNPVSMISYNLPYKAHVNLSVYDISGRLLVTLTDGWREAGTHEVIFDGSGLPSGIYFAKLDAGNRSQLQKLVLMK